MKTFLSLVVPVYNIQKEVSVLLNQLALIESGEIEIILVDDGSVDNSPALLDQFVKKGFKNGVSSPSAKVIHTKNSGLSAARNKGLKEACGEYIWFIDGDDLIDISKLDQVVQTLHDRNPDIMQFSYDRFVKNSDAESMANLDSNSQYNYISGEELFECLSKSRIDNFSWAHICKISLYVNNDILFPEGKVFEDIATTCQLFVCAKECIFWNYPLYHYRNRPESIMNEPSAKSCDDLFTVVMQTQDILRSLGANENSVKDFLLTNTYTAMMRTYEGQFELTEKKAIRRKIENYYLHLKVNKFEMRSIKILLIKLMIATHTYEIIQRKRGRIR
ncbi:glycosyltransferase family 2 protein [Lacticaseibacillus rhamnosus]|uniref:glycosyltransferase family 2 protein n=1 Tax=Lacticaseibacillus rhamnosus TaxID=47715 RepID=UPI0021A42E51|nr:glycosyltransferase family 2 protein [Lacticaseibacillus rhamnosus]MCT3171347.1 glycosyltransferase family 2 protein [Lacticaseibacillus rhamnosus]MCT3178793.1 glycosyltransferase family 2 protein [Lacticaseibacillus rhamnosus]MCT3182718.1 glycosyltransferase family 2 protein [Lacticaseibacillus rhamnosus]MCT4449644.1 glycosyltransferase family 2 protein [Lacticaseibacillus rhamnosus]